MINILKIITLAGTLVGLIILISSLFGLIKAQKTLRKASNAEFFRESDKLGIRRYFKLCIIGLSITTIMQFIRIFLI